MPGKILKHCDICKSWGARFLVNDPVRGKLYLCYNCAKKYRPADTPHPPSTPAPPSPKPT